MSGFNPKPDSGDRKFLLAVAGRDSEGVGHRDRPLSSPPYSSGNCAPHSEPFLVVANTRDAHDSRHASDRAISLRGGRW